MRKGIMIMVCLAVIVASLTSGCQQKNRGEKGKGKIYYSAIESGDYYEGWAEQLKAQSEKIGYEFEAGYAENSVETQDAQIKNALLEGSDVFLCGLVSSDIVTEIKAVVHVQHLNIVSWHEYLAHGAVIELQRIHRNFRLRLSHFLAPSALLHDLRNFFSAVVIVRGVMGIHAEEIVGDRIGRVIEELDDPRGSSSEAHHPVGGTQGYLKRVTYGQTLRDKFA